MTNGKRHIVNSGESSKPQRAPFSRHTRDIDISFGFAKSMTNGTAMSCVWQQNCERSFSSVQ